MGYVEAIKVAVFLFPIIAGILTLPYALVQYHKYGSISLLRTFIIFSFIFYMMCIYFLVILPLPDEDMVKPIREINTVPFSFVKEFMKESVFDVKDFSTYVPALKQSCFYVVIFNVFMTMPFGIYLRYYFKCSFVKVTILSLLLSMFFEITQYTGIYFIYEGSYRLCDVDDLIQNTFGGICGFIAAGAAIKVMPSKERIDDVAYKRGERVSGLRRICMNIADFIVFMGVYAGLCVATRKHYLIIFICLFSFYYIVIPMITKGRTIGAWLVNMRLDGPRILPIRVFFRMIFIIVYYIMPFALLFGYAVLVKYKRNQWDTKMFVILGIALLIICLIYFVYTVIVLITGRAFYDKIFKLGYISTVKKKGIKLASEMDVLSELEEVKNGEDEKV